MILSVVITHAQCNNTINSGQHIFVETHCITCTTTYYHVSCCQVCPKHI